MRAADEHRSARTGLNEADAPKNQRSHDALAEIRLGDDQRAKLLGRDQHRFDVLVGIAVDKGKPSGELRDFREELTPPLADDGNDVAETVALADGHDALEHDEHARAGLADREQPFAALVAARLPEAADALDLRLREQRKHLVAPV